MRNLELEFELQKTFLCSKIIHEIFRDYPRTKNPERRSVKIASIDDAWLSVG